MKNRIEKHFSGLIKDKNNQNYRHENYVLKTSMTFVAYNRLKADIVIWIGSEQTGRSG